MTNVIERPFDPALEWLDHVRPTGLVVAPMLLRELGLVPERQTQSDTGAVEELLAGEDAPRALADPWPFMERVLGWTPALVAGAPGGPPLPEELRVSIPEHETLLSPTYAVRAAQAEGFQLLVRIEAPGVEPDARGVLSGWEASPHQRFERLLRKTSVCAGVLLSDSEIRLVYAPRGETSGWLCWPIRPLATVAGRPMLGGLKLMLGGFQLFNAAPDRRLPALLKRSRDAQAHVSTRLAEQVLGALHELLRGFSAAEPDLIAELARTRPQHLYEGLLAVLMRLVFVLYAEDRDLIPSQTDSESRSLYHANYSLRGLYAKLRQDAALNPDTMDERVGGWGRILALFRLVHAGERSGWFKARGGKLFDPDQFPFLEGRRDAKDPPRVLKVSDGCLLRLLEGLMTIEDRGAKVRERLSYRALDVEQIGSVYETVMGFTVEAAPGTVLAIKAGKNNRTPVFVDLDRLAAMKPADRAKFVKEESERSLTDKQKKPIAEARSANDLAAALDSMADERGSPRKQIATKGTPILQPTDERRRTGSHYTPRSLTEPIVRYALEPAFERLGPDARPEQILDLKVCDPAMGSGAFLVEACRALALRLVQAWGLWPESRPAIPADEDEELHARRLGAQRCLYGVDKHPMATDLAKLSLWLATLAREHEFTFLDHALKSGDSLVGLTRKQMTAAHWDEAQPGLPLLRTLVKDRFEEALRGRMEIRTAPDDVARAIQESRHRQVEQRLDHARRIGDAVIAAFFAEEKPKGREKKRAEIESWLGGSPVAWDEVAALAATLKQGTHPLTPFHWEVEFPEVFARENGGFDAIVGNPPFLGGNKISGSLGQSYLFWLQSKHADVDGNSDLVAYFFRVSFHLLRATGAAGLLATNTICQGDTRRASLGYVISNNGQIYRARKRYPWPGLASVIVSIVHFLRSANPRLGELNLDGKRVKAISAFLLPNDIDDDPRPLAVNKGCCFRGVSVMGDGFIIDVVEAEKLIREEPRNKEILLPYIGGRGVNSDSRSQFDRYVINFGARTLEQAGRWSSLLRIVEQRVKPERDKRSGNAIALRQRKYWWLFRSDTPVLRAALGTKSKCIVASEVGPHLSFAFQAVGQVFANTLNVFALDEWQAFAVLQSRIHELWARLLGSSMKDDLRYNLSDCFETFGFPDNWRDNCTLEKVAATYHAHRAALMVGRNEGLTKTYNRFHDPTDTAEDIQRLRELHAAMDRAVLEAYGWRELTARAEPTFLDEVNEDDHTYQGRLFWPAEFRDEVLARLLALNTERHKEEVAAGVAPRQSRAATEDEDEETLEDA